MSEKKLKAVVLAAGKGTRMHSESCDLPKVMRRAMDRPLLGYVLSALDFIAPEDTVIVVGYKKEEVISAFGGYAFAEQKQQLGTGHAVMAAFDTLGEFDGDVLVCCGDMPLLERSTYEALCAQHRKSGAACTALSGYSNVDLPYGRILRDGSGRFLRVIEDRDCTAEQKAIRELNSGVYVFDAPSLRRMLTLLGRDNAQGEYYLTDVPELMKARDMAVDICCRELDMQIIGVNTPEQLAEVEAVLQSRK